MSDDIMEKTFQVTAPARLSVSNIRGSVTVQPGDPGVIHATAVKHNGFDGGKYSVEMVQNADGSVRVETRSHESMFGFLAHPPKVEYTLRVPQEIQLDVTCISATVDARSLSGKFKLRTVSGRINLADLSGQLNLNTVSGDISGTNLTGPLEVEAVSGRVQALDSSFATASVSTVSGNMHLQTALQDGPYNFSSVSGNVHLVVPEDTRCSAELKSVSGNIRSSFPATTSRLGHGLKIVQVQGGGTAVRMKSVSGSLSIEVEGVPAVPMTAEAPAVHEHPVQPEHSHQHEEAQLSTAEILQRIERGEMSVDEAIRQMKDHS